MMSRLTHWFQKTSIQAQLCAALLLATLVVTIVAGEVVRKIEGSYLENTLKTQSERIFSVLVATSLEAIISEDKPVLETIVQQLAQHDSSIAEIDITNTEGIVLVSWKKNQGDSSIPFQAYQKKVEFEGENFGNLLLKWDLRSFQENIESHVRTMRIITAAIVLIFTVVILVFINLLVLRPVRRISRRLGELSKGDLESKISLVAAKEFGALAESVNQLGSTMQENLRREKELIDAREELVIAYDKAVESTRLKSEFLSTMSHEIRTPMHGVLGMLDLLADTDLTEAQLEYLNTARSSGETLLVIINDILDFSRIEAGQMELEKISFNPKILVEEVTSLLAGKGHAKGLEVLCYVKPDVPEAVQGDPTRLRQVLTNLLGNAIKFTENGEVEVILDIRDRTDEVMNLAFTVRDTGIGISPEAQEKLFQAFVQADGSTTRKYGGTGLGLAISKNLIELMGGQIEVKSMEGAGSMFRFVLPFEPGELFASSRKTELAGLKVLAVDDNTTNLTIIEHYLRSWDVHFEKASSGPEALELLKVLAVRDSLPDIAILDILMPEMDGLQLARAIRNDPCLESIKLIVFSSHGTIPVDRMKEIGILQSLTKPVRQSQLLDVLMSVACRKPVQEQQSQHSSRKIEKASLKGRVLLVEDNNVNQIVAVNLLNKFGLNPEIASHGREAVAAVMEKKFDLILMDAQMPVMDGYEATGVIRKWERREKVTRTPIVAMTANAMSGDRERCLEAGMDDYLPKPVNPANFFEVLRRWLPSEEPGNDNPEA